MHMISTDKCNYLCTIHCTLWGSPLESVLLEHLETNTQHVSDRLWTLFKWIKVQ